MFTLSYWICVEIVDRADNSSLVSIVKNFDSVLEVYEGFCKLKQVCLLKWKTFMLYSLCSS